MDDITLKFDRLDKTQKKEIQAYLDSLLLEKTRGEKEGLSSYKKKILAVSHWNEKDISKIIENQQNLRGWKPKNW